MSLLDLLYLEDDKADAVIAAVRQWCVQNDCGISSEDGKRAIALAVRLSKSADGGGDFVATLSREMLASDGEPQVSPILVVEDELLIALDIEQTLLATGRPVHICPSTLEALDWLHTHRPGIAVLDIRLKDGPCTKLATVLHLKGIPFFVCSGAAQAYADEIFSQGRWIGKPFEPDILLGAVQDVLTRRVSRETVARPPC